MKKNCWILIGRWFCEDGNIFTTRVYLNEDDAIRDKNKYTNNLKTDRKYFYIEPSILYDNKSNIL